MSDKYCPMSLNRESGIYYCSEECPWWSEQYQKCAVLLAAESIRKQVK